MKEEWKAVKGVDNYLISNKGRIKHYTSKYGMRVLKNTNKKGDYLSVVLRGSNGNVSTRIHRLVAEYFIGEIPKGYQVHHKDGNKQNNCVDNLEILSPREHEQETRKMYPDRHKGLNRYNCYERPRHIKQLSLKGEFIAEYVNAQIAGRVTGVCSRNILQVASKIPFNAKGSIRTQAGGYKWEYADEGKGVAI